MRMPISTLPLQSSTDSAPEIARTEAEQSEAKAAFAAAEDVVNQLNIRAPLDGVVYSLPVLQGAYVNPGDLVSQEAAAFPVRVRTFVDEPAGGSRRETESTYPGIALPGYVDSVSRREPPDIRFVHEGSHSHLGKVRLLQYQVARIDVRPLEDRKRIHDPIEWSPDI